MAAEDLVVKEAGPQAAVAVEGAACFFLGGLEISAVAVVVVDRMQMLGSLQAT